MFRKGGRAPNPMHQEDVFMHYRDPSSRSERGGESKAPADRATPPVRQPYSHPPALQRKPLTTRLAFPQERQADGRKTNGPQEDQRITGGPVRQECGNATYPATLTVGTADPGKGTHLLIILSLYRLIDRRCSSPPELVLAYRGRPPVGRP